MRAIVVGGGIGGLSQALSLHAAGIEVALYEAVQQPAPLGLGINLQPNAVRELTELGLYDALADVAIETSEVRFYNQFGQEIWREPRGRAAGYAWPQFCIHRGELAMILLGAVRQRIGDDNLHFGQEFVDFDQDGSGVVARFVDPVSRDPLPPAHGDVLIGADGIHSRHRRLFYPDDKASYRGAAFRGAAEIEPFLDGRTMVVIGNKRTRAITYPCSRRVAEQGRSLLNVIFNPRGYLFEQQEEG